MTTAILKIEDQGDEVHVECGIEPAITPDQQVFNTVELVALYLREHMGQIMTDAVKWARKDEPLQ